ncbi:MAG: tetratricopeptide repeat protein [Negativicutes bacterium]|nr:tetratricopeptide repeat protein [Negativicutes bacterium]
MPKQLLTALLMLFTCFAALPGSLCEAADNPLLSSQDKIIAECTAAVAADPNDYIPYYRRAQAYLAKNMYDEAISDCSRAIEIKPDYAAAYYTRGRINHDRKKWDAATEDYSQAIKCDPSYAQAYSNRAFCYNQKEQYDLAIVDATKAIELSPKLVQYAYFQLGEAYTKKKQYDDAIAAYRAAIANLTDVKFVEMAKGRIRALGGTV